jgi:hypothetical protein
MNSEKYINNIFHVHSNNISVGSKLFKFWKCTLYQNKFNNIQEQKQYWTMVFYI